MRFPPPIPYLCVTTDAYEDRSANAVRVCAPCEKFLVLMLQNQCECLCVCVFFPPVQRNVEQSLSYFKLSVTLAGETLWDAAVPEARSHSSLPLSPEGSRGEAGEGRLCEPGLLVVEFHCRNQVSWNGKSPGMETRFCKRSQGVFVPPPLLFL